MNGYLWHIKYVNPNDAMLVDRTNKLRVATTDPYTRTVYLSTDLYGDFRIRVVIHELAHCALVSFDLLYDIHRMVKREYWIEAEELVCNFLADYGLFVFGIARSIIGDDILSYIPYEFERLIA